MYIVVQIDDILATCFTHMLVIVDSAPSSLYSKGGSFLFPAKARHLSS